MSITSGRKRGYKRPARRSLEVIHRVEEMDRQATQPAPVPSGRKRRRVSKKQKQEEEAQAPAAEMKADHDLEMAELGLSRAELLEMKTTQPPTSELVIALNALPKAADQTPLPPPSPTDQSVNELMEGTLKDYEEECIKEGREEQVLNQMDAQFNQLLYESCPFHPHQFIECVNPQVRFGPLRFKCPQEGCPVYLFEDTREVMMEKLKEDTHPQVHARVKRGELKCKCGFVPKMKLSRTAKNYNKVFFSCGSFVPGREPCGYFQWLHGPLWCPREQAQPTLRRWVHDTPLWKHPGMVPKESVPLLKGKQVPEMEKPHPWGIHHEPAIEKIKRSPWMNQFGDSVKAQENAFERRRHFYKNFGSLVLF